MAVDSHIATPMIILVKRDSEISGFLPIASNAFAIINASAGAVTTIERMIAAFAIKRTASVSMLY